MTNQEFPTDDPAVVTCGLPYANGDLHVGHLRTYVSGDAYARSLDAELAGLQGQAHDCVLSDLRAFFDIAMPAVLVRAALAMGSHPRPLYCSLMVHLSPRVLDTQGYHSTQPLLANNSIMAGLVDSVVFARAFVRGQFRTRVTGILRQCLMCMLMM